MDSKSKNAMPIQMRPAITKYIISFERACVEIAPNAKSVEVNCRLREKKTF